MKVILILNSNVDPVLNLNLKRFLNDYKDCYLFIGNAYLLVFSDRYNDKLKCYLTLLLPNFCTDVDGPHAKLTSGYGSVRTNGPVFQGPHADRVLTLCPFTALLDSKRTQVFFPYNLLHIFERLKKYDVVYSGGRHAPFLRLLVKRISKFNYRYIYFQNHIGLVTDMNASYLKKLQIIALSKITVCHGLLFPNNTNINRLKQYPLSSKNKAMLQLWNDLSVLGRKAMPQIKSRVFEGAFNKSLILNYYDQWNVILDYFTPGEDFIYFYDMNDLLEKIRDICNNYNKYLKIILNAYNKAINNYTTKHFIDKYIK